MQWICFITCLVILLLNVYVAIRMGLKAVSWEAVYVMGFVCECIQQGMRDEVYPAAAMDSRCCARGSPCMVCEADQVYICIFAGTFYGFTIWLTWSSPVLVYLNTGNFVVMLRYGQWLFCTPVSSGKGNVDTHRPLCIYLITSLCVL